MPQDPPDIGRRLELVRWMFYARRPPGMLGRPGRIEGEWEGESATLTHTADEYSWSLVQRGVRTDFGPGEVIGPVVEGRFVAEIPGMHGLRWYLFELERDLPSGFDPLYMRRQSSETALHYLLLWPAPAIPTSETPENFIGDALERGEVVPVGVSVGAEPQDLPFAINTDELSRFPYVCSGDLEALA